MIKPVRSQLLKTINEQKRDNNFFLASFLLDNFTRIPNMTIYAVSEESFVSTAAISRFMKKIGFASFTEFKQACKDAIDIREDYAKEIILQPEADIKSFAKMYSGNIVGNLQEFAENLDGEQFQRINSYLHDAKLISLYGLEFVSILAQHFQIKFAEMGKIVKIGATPECQFQNAKEMAAGDVALIFSIEGGYFYYNDATLDELIDRGAKIIVFTQSRSPMIERKADEIILCGTNNSNTEGRLTLLYVMELLIYQYMSAYYL